LRSDREREKAGYEEQTTVTVFLDGIERLPRRPNKNAAILRLMWRRALSMKIGELQVSLIPKPLSKAYAFLSFRGEAFPLAGAAVAGTPLLRGDPPQRPL